MNKEEFKDLLLKIDDLLIDVDYWRRQIDQCRECRGWAVEDPNDMCPSCRESLHKHLIALQRISNSNEMRKNLIMLKEALEKDRTGELTDIYNQSRSVTQLRIMEQ